MTVKQIAQATNKTERSVRNWIKKVTEKNSFIREKISVSSPAYPADYNFEETILIIEQGLGKNAAMIYKQNTTQTEKKEVETNKNEIIFTGKQLEYLIEKGILIKGTEIKHIPAQIESVNSLEPIEESIEEKKRMFNSYVHRIREIKNQPFQKAYNEIYYIIAKSFNIDDIINLDYLVKNNLLDDSLEIVEKMYRKLKIK